MLRRIFSIIVLACLSFNCSSYLDKVKIESPSKSLNITAKKVGNDMFYRVLFNDSLIIKDSKLGILFKDKTSLFENTEIYNIDYNSFDNSWELPWGESRLVRNNYNEAIISFRAITSGYDFDIIFRAYDDGVAFRYDVKNSSHNQYVTITDEITQFNVQEQASAWWTPAYGPNRYEELYKKTKINEIDTSHTPFTFKYENGIHLSIHEASLTNYSSMQLYYQKQDGLVVDLAPWNNGDKVRTEIPFVTPWRTIMITNSAKELIQSNLILNCNEPIAIDDVSWLKPVKYIGIWWGMITGKWTWDEGFRHGATNERSKKYIDFAAKHGFDEVLIEGWASGWQGLFPEDSVTVSFTKSTNDFDFDQIQTYARSKGISIKAYHETMANTKNYLAQIDSAFKMLNKLGISNVKIGQVGKRLDQSEFHYGQYGVNYYRAVLEKAVQYKIGVNFHEPIKDTGERRTFPNMMTREGAKGMEYNAWIGGNPPDHTTILPFTRLLNSPMDYTPGIFDIMLKNLDTDPAKEYPIEFVVVDSGNQFNELLFKSGESLWKEIPMVLDTVINEDKNIYIWKLVQNYKVGDWQWGVSANHPNTQTYDIWLPQLLKNTKNRKVSLNEKGKIEGQFEIRIPFQNFSSNSPTIGNKVPLAKKVPRISTTLSKQLALYVIIHSPMQMAADFIENYENMPPFQFIKDVPVVWDTTIAINGEIGEYVTIARKDRFSQDWYLGSITNDVERDFEIDLSFLREGIYEATIYADHPNFDWESNPNKYKISVASYSNENKHRIQLSKGGGQAIRFRYLDEF